MTTPKHPIRFAVVGGGRGKTFIHSTKQLIGRAELTAICDRSQAVLDEWKGLAGMKLYTDFGQVLDDPEIDAVCLATPVTEHAWQSIAALKAGKHVLCEVTAARTLEECWELIETVEKTGLTYMMAENYCFTQPAMQVLNMVEQGVFGEIIYASGSYVHDCRDLYFTPEGGLTWRGEVKGRVPSNSYPTHSLGPVAQWLGINRSDRFATTATWQSQRGLALSSYAARNFREKPEYADPGFWNQTRVDTVTTSIRTLKGVLIDIRLDSVSPRPHNMTRYELQGTKASYCKPDGIAGVTEPLIWIEGRSPGYPSGVAKEWEPLSKYREEFDHPWWREFGEEAIRAGHGGGDFFILREFVSAIEEGRRPLIDVYDSVTWSSITPLSAISIREGNSSVEVPDFAAGRRS